MSLRQKQRRRLQQAEDDDELMKILIDMILEASNNSAGVDIGLRVQLQHSDLACVNKKARGLGVDELSFERLERSSGLSMQRMEQELQRLSSQEVALSHAATEHEAALVTEKTVAPPRHGAGASPWRPMAAAPSFATQISVKDFIARVTQSLDRPTDEQLAIALFMKHGHDRHGRLSIDAFCERLFASEVHLVSAQSGALRHQLIQQGASDGPR